MLTRLLEIQTSGNVRTAPNDKSSGSLVWGKQTQLKGQNFLNLSMRTLKMITPLMEGGLADHQGREVRIPRVLE